MSPTTAERIAEVIVLCGVYSHILLFFIGWYGCAKFGWLKGRWTWFLTFMFLLPFPAMFYHFDILPDCLLFDLLLPYVPFAGVLLLCAIMRLFGRPCSKRNLAGMLCLCGFFFFLSFAYWYGLGHEFSMVAKR